MTTRPRSTAGVRTRTVHALASALASWALASCALASCALGCEPDPAPTAPEPAPPTGATVEEVVSASQGPLTLSVRNVAQDGWSGRLVVATLAAEGRALRVLPSPRPTPLSEIVAGVSPRQPFAAICGGFYDPSGAPMGLVRAGGVEHHALGERGGSGVLAITGGGARVEPATGFEGAGVTDALQSIDRLVVRGESVVGAGASDRRAARSAIALGEDGAVHLAVAFDERAVVAEDAAVITLGPGSAQTGPTLAQWAALLRADPAEGGLGARDALGLDGGFSTSLVVKSDARALSVIAARATINAILVAYPDG